MSLDADKIAQLGETLGITGKELLEFIREENNKAREERALDRAEKQAEREHQLAQSNRVSQVPEPSLGNLKLLPYKEGDDISAYFTRFERIAAIYKWNDSHMALQLGSLLEDRALSIYSTLDIETTASYDKLKPFLLSAYKLNEETYR